jgi:hypothetical protein
VRNLTTWLLVVVLLTTVLALSCVAEVTKGAPL